MTGKNRITADTIGSAFVTKGQAAPAGTSADSPAPAARPQQSPAQSAIKAETKEKPVQASVATETTTAPITQLTPVNVKLDQVRFIRLKKIAGYIAMVEGRRVTQQELAEQALNAYIDEHWALVEANFTKAGRG